jgi:hypothetical protein
MGAFIGIFTFLTSPFGRWVGVGLIGVAVFFAGELRGRRIANDKCEAKAQEAIRAANQQDAKARAEVSQQAETTINDLRGQKEKADARLALLEKELSVRPLDAPCMYGADGKPASRVRNQPVPAPRASNPGTPRSPSLPPAGSGTAGPRGK